MRLLLTRAEPEAQSSAARLRTRGHQVLIAPMLEIVLLPPPGGVSRPAAIALTSANAVRALAAWPVARGWTDTLVFAVGDRTAEAAAAAGFGRVESAKGGSIELAALIERRVQPQAGAILYPAAETPTGNLGAALRQAGHEVEQVIAYRADPATNLPPKALAAIRERSVDAALFYSERGAGAFADIVLRADLGPSLAGVELLALSVQVAGPLRALPGASISVAPQPTEASLFALLAADG